jgi:hypothetical protein
MTTEIWNVVLRKVGKRPENHYPHSVKQQKVNAKLPRLIKQHVLQTCEEAKF